MSWIYIIDFGLVVLIWMVQLVVYPSFKYFLLSELLNWHRSYTSGITLVVLPLMLAQVILHTVRLYDDLTLINGWMLMLVLSTWVITFTIFVPLHHKITSNQDVTSSLVKLVKYNWLRTMVWSLIFLCDLYFVTA
jgi:hypothetical protein